MLPKCVNFIFRDAALSASAGNAKRCIIPVVKRPKRKILPSCLSCLKSKWCFAGIPKHPWDVSFQVREHLPVGGIDAFDSIANGRRIRWAAKNAPPPTSQAS